MSICFCSGNAKQILTKLGMGIMPQEATPVSSFLISFITNIADAHTCEVGANIEPLNVTSLKPIELLLQ